VCRDRSMTSYRFLQLVAQMHDARQVGALVRVLGDVLTLQQYNEKHWKLRLGLLKQSAEYGIQREHLCFLASWVPLPDSPLPHCTAPFSAYTATFRPVAHFINNHIVLERVEPVH
jgi:hypothetical protein